MGNTLSIINEKAAGVGFDDIREAVHAIQNTMLTNTRIALLTNSTVHRAFVKRLAGFKRPLGLVLVVPRD